MFLPFVLLGIIIILISRHITIPTGMLLGIRRGLISVVVWLGFGVEWLLIILPVVLIV
jgi:hypothetical protein